MKFKKALISLASVLMSTTLITLSPVCAAGHKYNINKKDITTAVTAGTFSLLLVGILTISLATDIGLEIFYPSDIKKAITTAPNIEVLDAVTSRYLTYAVLYYIITKELKDKIVEFTDANLM